MFTWVPTHTAASVLGHHRGSGGICRLQASHTGGVGRWSAEEIWALGGDETRLRCTGDQRCPCQSVNDAALSDFAHGTTVHSEHAVERFLISRKGNRSMNSVEDPGSENQSGRYWKQDTH